VVLLFGYGAYHFSGVKTAVNTVSSAKSSLESAKNQMAKATPDPKVAIGWLKSVANSYAGAIPGGAFLLDQTFDQLEKLADTHGDEVKKILNDSYAEIQKVVSEAKGKDVGDQVTIVIQKAVGQMQKLTGNVSENYLQPLLEKSPNLKKALQGSEQQLQQLAAKHGPKAQKIVDDTLKQINEISNKGLNGETIAKIVSLVQTKTKEVAALAQDASKDAYADLSSSVEPLMNSMPDVKKMLDDNVDKLKAVIGDKGVDQVRGLYKELEDLQKSSKGKDATQLAKEAKELISSKMGDLQNSLPSSGAAASAAAGAVSSIPGLSTLMKDLPDFQELHQAAEKHGDKGQDLLKSTYAELKEVLEKKGKEAKKLAGEAKEDVKKST